MSFLGGAECSTAGNPLSQFTKHVQDDKTLQRDRLVGRGPGGLQEGMRSQGMAPGSQDHMMNDFMQQQGQIPQGPGPASPFAMEQMRRDLEQTTQQRPTSQSQWASEFNPGIEETTIRHPSLRNNGFNPAEFARYQHVQNGGAVREAQTKSPPAMNTYQRPLGMGYSMGMNGMGISMGMMPQSYSGVGMRKPEVESKGKGRMIELDDNDWETQFKELETNQEDLEILDEEAREAMERQLNDLDRSVPSETNDFGDFESLWRGIQAETAAARELVNEERFADGMHLGDDFERFEGFDGLNTHLPTQAPELGNYLFEQENPFNDLHDPFNEGLIIMREGGNLSLAALAFEAAVQKDPSHTDAWVRLGAAQAQNEKESPAIRALEQALKLDPSNLEALMGLAVSYTNEGYDSTAYRTLERWLSTKYPDLAPSPALSGGPGDDLGFTERHLLQQRVTDLFIAAAQRSPSGDSMDPDVQVGLGVLFYGAEEYDKAIDCFSAALASSEAGIANRGDQLHLLWNRLGATLANSGSSEQAIQAYERALELRPNFVRARYNLGVSCINIGCYEEAAQHLLGALAMHRVVEREGAERVRQVIGDTGGPDGKGVLDERELERLVQQNQSTNLYDTLRRVFSHMGRRDLGDKVGPGMDVETFRGEFEF